MRSLERQRWRTCWRKPSREGKSSELYSYFINVNPREFIPFAIAIRLSSVTGKAIVMKTSLSVSVLLNQGSIWWMRKKPLRMYNFRLAVGVVLLVVRPFLELKRICFHIAVKSLHVYVDMHTSISSFFGFPFHIAVRTHIHVIPFHGRDESPRKR